MDKPSSSPTLPDSEAAEENSMEPVSRLTLARMTRLLCARVYLYGVFASVPAAFRITRPLFHARDPGVGYDKRVVLFHSFQSIALSIAFAAPALVIFGNRGASESGYYGLLGYVALFVAIFKVGLLNPLLARAYFSRRGQHRELRLRGLAPLVDFVVRWMLPSAETEEANVCYFAGDRPFVGHGTEISAWTIVIDTSAPASSVSGFVGGVTDPIPIDPATLYRAILGCSAMLRVDAVQIGWRTFLQGTSANDQRKRSSLRFARPPHRLSAQLIDELDREGETGRRYMLLTMEKASLGLIASQFVRFQSNGKLIFCEFSSYILSAGLPRLYRLDRLFELSDGQRNRGSRAWDVPA